MTHQLRVTEEGRRYCKVSWLTEGRPDRRVREESAKEAFLVVAGDPQPQLPIVVLCDVSM